jgi:hypothetical protein
MHRCDIAPSSGVRSLVLEAHETSLHSIGQLFPDVTELDFTSPASLCAIDSASVPAPLLNLHSLTVAEVLPSVELLFDGITLPHLRCLYAKMCPLFITLTRRANQMRPFDTIEYLAIHKGNEESFSLKQWHTVLDALPRLRTLLVDMTGATCPPPEMADLLVDYVRRAAGRPLVLSFGMNKEGNEDKKKQFISYLRHRTELVCPCALFAAINETRLDVWM